MKEVDSKYEKLRCNLYISSTMSSILLGLGKAGTTFFCNVTGLLIRLFFVFFFIPAFGIKGYMWGLLASELTITLMEIAFVKHYIHPTTQCT